MSDTTPNITTNVESKVDFRFTKDDILFIAVQAKEEELEKELTTLLEEKEELETTFNKEQKSFFEAIDEVVLKHLKATNKRIKLVAVNIDGMFTRDPRIKPVLTGRYVDMQALLKYSNPKLALKRVSREIALHKEVLDFTNYSINFELSTTLFDTKVILEKRMVFRTKEESKTGIYNAELNEEILSLVEKHLKRRNKLNLEIFKIRLAGNAKEIELALLEKDKTLRANLYKQILEQNVELKKLLQ